MCEIIQDLDDRVCWKIVEYVVHWELDPEWDAPPELNRIWDPIQFPENGNFDIKAPVIKVKTLLNQTSFANKVTKFIKDMQKIT